DLAGGLEKCPALTRYGSQEAVIKGEPQGLRVIQAADRGDTNPARLDLTHRLRGDFDIVLGYELLAVGGPTPQYGVGVTVRVWFDNPSSLCAILSRTRKPNGELFSAHKVLKGPDDKERYLDNKDLKATKTKGKLRLVRTGSQLQYLVEEADQGFKQLQSIEIGTDDIRLVQLFCHTMHKPI